jgi:hypothetical protein
MLRVLYLVLPLASATALAQLGKVEGYDGYKFGMTVDQARAVKPIAKQTPCDFVNVITCLEYETRVTAFPATAIVQFTGAPPLLSAVLLTIRSSDEPSGPMCHEIGQEVLSLLLARYGAKPLIRTHAAIWASPEGGSVSLLARCDGEGRGTNIIVFKPSGAL